MTAIISTLIKKSKFFILDFVAYIKLNFSFCRDLDKKIPNLILDTWI